MFRRCMAIMVVMSVWIGGVGCTPKPGPLEVGLATARMPVPVGIGTVGYGGFGFNQPSPFSDLYPATEAVHGHPDFRVVSISRGEGFEVIFVRSDMVGVFQQLRQAVLRELEVRTGRNLDDVLVMGATQARDAGAISGCCCRRRDRCSCCGSCGECC